MKKVINGNRFKDIEDRYKQYEDNRSKQRSAREAQIKSFYADTKKVEKQIENYIYSKLESAVDTQYFDNFEVQCKLHYYLKDDVYVHVLYERNDAALRWNWDCTISDTDVKRETGSWSGLKAVTSSQLDELQNCVNALNVLSGIDDETILKLASKARSNAPKYGDYVTQEVDPEINKQDKIIEMLGSLAGTDYLVKSNAKYSSSSIYRSPSVWYHINKETDKMFQVEEYRKLAGRDLVYVDTYNKRKDTFAREFSLPLTVKTEQEINNEESN